MRSGISGPSAATAVVLSVRVIPRAAQSGIAGKRGDAWLVRLHAPPVEGAANDEPPHSVPYNLLVTRRWLLAVPRSKERFGTIAVNALGFAGSLFARDDGEMKALREAGPMRVLREVAA